MQNLLEIICFAILLAGPLPLCFIASIYIGSVKTPARLPHIILVILTCWCILQACVGLLGGALGILSTPFVLGSETALLAAGLAIISLRRKMLASIQRMLRRGSRLKNLEMLILVAVLILGLHLLWTIASRPITDYDSLAYHLPMMANWFQSGAFTVLDQFPQISRYPFNWETVCFLFLTPFGEDFLVALPNLVAWVILGLAAYLLGRSLGSGRTSALAATALVLVLPILIEGVNTMHVDLPLGAFFAVGLYLALYSTRSRSPAALALFVATLGMLAGIKTTGIVYGLVLLVVLAVAWFQGRTAFAKSASTSKRTIIIASIISLVVFLWLGGFWYCRNLLETGNPLGFVKIELAGLTLFDGELDPQALHRTTLAAVFNPALGDDWQVMFVQIKKQLGVPFLAMVSLSLVLPFGIFATRRRIKAADLIMLVALALALGCIYWLTPYSADNGLHGFRITHFVGQAMRYAFPFLTILGVAAALGAARPRVPAVGVATVAFFSCYTIIAGEKLLLYLAVGLTLAWWAVRATQRTIERLWSRTPIAIETAVVIAIVLITASFLIGARGERADNRHEVYGNLHEFLTTELSQGEPIGYLWSHRSFLLYGPDLGRKVVHLPARTDELGDWLEELRRSGVSVVAVGPLQENWRTKVELLWLRDPDGPFVRIFGEDPEKEIVIYRFTHRIR